MLGVHIRLNLEHEAREDILFRFHQSLIGFTRLRCWSPLHQPIKHVIHTKIAQRSTKEHRRELAREEGLQVELMRRPFHQLNLVPEITSVASQDLIQLRILEPLDHPFFLDGMALAGFIQNHFIPGQVIDTFKILPHTDGPGNRCAGDFEDILNLIHQLHRITRITVQLVHEGQYWRVPQSGYFHQLDRAFLNTFGAVDHHQTRVHRC